MNQVPLNSIFSCNRGNSKYTKRYCHLHKGKYEVYTGTTIGHFGSIDTYEYTTPKLTYTTDGVYAGTVKIINDEKYNVGGHRAILEPLENNADKIDLQYFEFVLNALFKKNVKDGSVPSLTWTNIKTISVPVPIDENGNYDLEQQKRMSDRLKSLSIKRKKLEQKYIELSESYITISENHDNYIPIPLNKMFVFERGGSCTRAYCNQHKGEYPVWSANNITPLAYVDFYAYNGKYITLSRNGIAGKIKIIDGKFNINEDRFLLIPRTKEIRNQIDYDYIRYTVEPILRSKRKGREGHNGENEFTKLSFTILNNTIIKMPITENGEYDIERQQEYAQKYEKIYHIKKEICKILESIISTEILVDNRVGDGIMVANRKTK